MFCWSDAMEYAPVLANVQCLELDSTELICNCVAAHETGKPKVLFWSLLSMVGALKGYSAAQQALDSGSS